jgi:glycosyltransferase involved in cell wall biosynthesis
MSIKLSIIIPMYKVADYVTRCIESLEQQDIPQSEYEIICINDGSPDNCKEIVENLQQKYSNIILLNQENQGVSMARNNGIAIASGKYILPIDPDDYVMPNSFGNIVALVEKLECEVLYLGFEIFDIDQKSIWKTNYSQQNHQLFDGVEGYFQARGFDVKDPDRSWAILYKKELLDAYKITYPKNVPYLEDGLFLSKVFSVAQKVSFENTIFYQRTTRIGSATNSRLFYSEKAIDGFIIAVNDIKEFKNQSNLSDQQVYLINHTIAKFVILSISPSISRFDYKEYLSVLRKLKDEKIYKLESKGLRFLYKRHIKVFNFSKLLFPIYFKLFNR